jgi:hypothetical protein
MQFVIAYQLFGALITLGFFCLVATVEVFLIGPFLGLLPLVLGFSLPLPWAVSITPYVVGVPGYSRSLQFGAQAGGQLAWPGYPFRSHTTGLLDWAVRNDVPGAGTALELIHPGRTDLLLQERSFP